MENTILLKVREISKERKIVAELVLVYIGDFLYIINYYPVIAIIAEFKRLLAYNLLLD